VEPIRILLLDDHQIVREGIRRMLQQETDMQVVGDAANAEEAFTQADSLSPDIVLMDIKMPGTNGIEATRRLKERHPACKIIMLTTYEEYLTQAIGVGAEGYLLKDIKSKELVSAIRAVQQGCTSLSPFSQESLTEVATSIGRSHLTERELAILRLIANGATTDIICAQLFLSQSTVKRDTRRIFDKLGVHSRYEAVAEACKRNIVYA
jgi:DNA-binding NarL/FixJ family response regulator